MPRCSLEDPLPLNAMSTTLADEAASTLRTYVNDMIAVERDVYNAVRGQIEDERVREVSEVHALLTEIAAGSRSRLDSMEALSAKLDGKFGAAVKEAVAAATGALAGIYGKVRKHPVSRMLRDDQVALNLCATAYGMLYTTALVYDEEEVAIASLEHLNALPSQIIGLTRVIPGIVVKELTEEHPGHPEAATIAQGAILAAWGEA
jgi:hypothetical protein